eukprot:gene17650-9294_t
MQNRINLEEVDQHEQPSRLNMNDNDDEGLSPIFETLCAAFYLFPDYDDDPFQAMIDVSADQGWLANVLHIITIIQMVNQGRWHTDCPLLQLPAIDQDLLDRFKIRTKNG